MQPLRFYPAPEGVRRQSGLREVGIPAADAGLRNALRSAYVPCADLPADFMKLLDRLR